MIYNGAVLANNQCGSIEDGTTIISKSDSNAISSVAFNSTNTSSADYQGSTIESELNTWYTSNITDKTKLESFNLCIDLSTSADYPNGIAYENETTSSTNILVYKNNNLSNNTRKLASSGSGAGTGTVSLYSSYRRFYYSTTPTLTCNRTGAKTILASIGLLTMDEAMYTGTTSSSNSSYYLYNNQYWWLLSPYGVVYFGYARVWFVGSSGVPGDSDVGVAYGARPVVSLNSEVGYTNSDLTNVGTYANPCVIE